MGGRGASSGVIRLQNATTEQKRIMEILKMLLQNVLNQGT